jgi:flavin-dependent dehydrogenase
VEIQIDPHTLERAEERGTNEAEIRDVIINGFPIPAKHSRLGRAKIYVFDRKRHDKYYAQKRVEVIYTLEKETVVTVTVYVFYGSWEGEDADSV